VELANFLQTIPRITDPFHPFQGCLCDPQDSPLLFDPVNVPSPPQGCGVQLCYRALPQYENIVLQRKQNIQQNLQQMSPDQKLLLKELLKKLLGTKIQSIPRNEDELSHLYKQLLQGKSQPVPINTEDELAYLYLQEFYKQKTSCDITELDRWSAKYLGEGILLH